jgi:predicted DNA-binding transcriptional regulator AlpA
MEWKMTSSTSQLAIATALTPPRIALRKPAVLSMTGWSNSTLYAKMAEGKFPRSTKLDHEGRAVVWWSDEVAAFQQRAIERQAQAA